MAARGPGDRVINSLPLPHVYGSCVFNAANEQAVALFLAGRIRFGDITRAIESALDAFSSLSGATRDELLAADAAGRRHVMEFV